MKRLAKKHAFKPTMEALESRWCPATTVSPLQNGVVTITGDDTVNTVSITQNDNLNKLVVKTEGSLSYSDVLGRTVIHSVFEFSSDQVTDVVISLRGGNDQLTYQLGGGSDFVNGKRIKVDLGSGDDVATFNFADNGAGGLASVHRLNLDIQAGAGKDQVDAFFGTVYGGYSQNTPTEIGVRLTGNMGYGDDRFDAELRDVAIDYSPHYSSDGQVLPQPPDVYGSTWIDMEDMNDLVIRDALRPSTILATIPGGNDDFRVNCDAAFLQHKDRDLGVTLKGGDGKDNLQFKSDGELNSNLVLALDGQAGADTVTGDITLDPASTGSVIASVFGGIGDDTLTLRISNQGAGTVRGLLDGGYGFDNFNKTLNVTDENCEIGWFF